MRHIHPLLNTLLPAALALLSCAQIPPIPAPEDEIVFRSEGLAPDTKAAQVTALSSFYVSAVTGTPGADTEAWTSVPFTQEGTSGTYKGGQYWPGSDPSYRFYASNLPLTFAAGGPMVSASNTTDAVCAYLPSPTYRGADNALTFSHIFARISTVTVSADSDFSISNVTVWIRDIKTGGTYNLLTGAGQTDGTGWSDLVPAASADTQIFREAGSIAPGESRTGSDNELCFVPGEYVLVATWTAGAGSYTGTISGKISPVQTFAAGEEQTIAITLSGGEIVVKVGPADDSGDHVRWASAFSPSAFSVAPGKTVEFSPGNLQARISSGPTNTYVYAADQWRFAEHQWDYCNKALAIGNWVDHFAWVGNSASYNSYGLLTLGSQNATYHGNVANEALKTDWGAIPGLVNTLGAGWRTLTKDEWVHLFDTRTTASGVRYAKATVNGISGVILLPDNWSASYYTLASTNTAGAAYTVNQISESVWNASFEPHGAVFLPAAGVRNGTVLGDVGSNGNYWSGSSNIAVDAYDVAFGSGHIYLQNVPYRFRSYSVRLVRDSEPHLFSISPEAEAEFSPGNLQYQASTGAWRFAEHQWDYVGDGGTTGGNVSGSTNASISSSYSGWIDLFGWGTSGHAFASGYGSAYQPWSTSTVNTDYGPTDGISGLISTYKLGDWGVKNAIGSYPAGTWRTPTNAEWGYLFDTRPTPSGIRYAKATVNGVTGIILLPDDWSASYYALASTNTAGAAYTANTISLSDWTYKLEAHGAIFLPAAGYRGNGTIISSVGLFGIYWSSTANGTTEAYRLTFNSTYVNPHRNLQRYDGYSVRLLRARVEPEPEPEPQMLPGRFTVAAGRTVRFSRGNLRASTTNSGATWTWSFAPQQWSYIGNAAGNNSIDGIRHLSTVSGTVDLFGWNGASSSNDSWGIYNSTNNADYGNNASDALKTDWGSIPGLFNTLGLGWRTLTQYEWEYIINGRPQARRFVRAIIRTDASSNANIKGVILFPDDFPASDSFDGVTFRDMNGTGSYGGPDESYWTTTKCTTCTEAGWQTLESAGCVFLSAAGYRSGNTVETYGARGHYWSSTPNTDIRFANSINFYAENMFSYHGQRNFGFSVRLVR